jgi:diaminopropionate ammonia-lyase
MAFAADVQRGYHTLFAESVEQLAGAPDLLFIQAGVGALAASAAAFADAHGLATQIVTVEPVGSACVQASIQHGEPTAVLDTFTTMAGLRAQHVSALAWPVLRDRITAAVSVSDTQAEAAMRILATQHVVAGESGAAGLAGLVRVGHAPWARRALGVRHSTTIAVVNTEGATDAERYARVVGPHGVAPRA